MRRGALLAAALLLAGAATARAEPGEAACAAAPAAEAGEAGAALERGNRLAETGAVDGALAAYAESEALARRDGPPGLALLARANAARTRIDAGRTDGVAAALEGLLAEAAALSESPARARVRTHLALSLAGVGRTRQAAEVLRLAEQDARGHDARLESYAQGYLAELYEQGGRPNEALVLGRRALFTAQRAGAPDAVVRWQWLLGRVLREQGDAAGALDAYRAAVQTLRAAPGVGETELEPLYLELVDQLLTSVDGSDSANDQARLAEARAVLEDLKVGELRDYFRDPCLAAKRQAAPDTLPGALVVYPISLPDRLELIAGRRGRLSRHVVPVDGARYAATVLRFRHLVEKRTTREYRPLAAALYEWLIRPLTLEGVDTLVFVPGGVTRSLPLAALYDDRSDQFLVEQVPIAITPGLTLTEPHPVDWSGVRVLAAGISDSVQGYPALAAVKREIQSLPEDFEVRRLLDDEFVAARFEAEVRDRVFDVVHVASHGEFLADASDSYLLTHDGRISMDRMAGLVGTTRFRERGLELLTLSACRTAAGDDRAALGLAGVALRAGARSALATLWAVNDAVTSELMTRFYEHLLEPDVSRAQALQRAQLDILSNRFYRHPIYWAPFVMISSWL